MNKRLCISLLLVTLLGFSGYFSVCHAWVSIPTTSHLGYGNDCYLSFDKAENFSTVYRVASSNATYPDFWFFGDSVLVGFNLVGCNLTVTDFFEAHAEKLLFTLHSASTGSGTVKLCRVTPATSPLTVSGATFTYDSGSNVATLTATLTGGVDLEVTVSWVAESTGGGGGGGAGGAPTPAPFLPEPSPFLPSAAIADVLEGKIGLEVPVVVIVAVVVVAFIAFSENERKRKQWRSKPLRTGRYPHREE